MQNDPSRSGRFCFPTSACSSESSCSFVQDRFSRHCGIHRSQAVEAMILARCVWAVCSVCRDRLPLSAAVQWTALSIILPCCLPRCDMVPRCELLCNLTSRLHLKMFHVFNTWPLVCRMLARPTSNLVLVSIKRTVGDGLVTSILLYGHRIALIKWLSNITLPPFSH